MFIQVEKALSKNKTAQNVDAQIYENILKLLHKSLFHIKITLILGIRVEKIYLNTTQLKLWIVKTIKPFQ